MYTFAFLCITLAMFACLCGAAFTAVFLWRRPVATATPNAGGKRRGARAALVAAGPEQAHRFPMPQHPYTDRAQRRRLADGELFLRLHDLYATA